MWAAACFLTGAVIFIFIFASRLAMELQSTHIKLTDFTRVTNFHIEKIKYLVTTNLFIFLK